MRVLRLLLISICLLGSGNAVSKELEIGGWNEAVITVRYIDDYQAFFIDIAKWEQVSSGEVSQAQLRAWGLGEQILEGGVNARYRTYANPGTERGSVRLVQFNGIEQTHNRVDEQSWDSGGIFNLNMRVKDLKTSAEQMRSLGWQSRAPITQFEFGPFEVKEWIVRSPDGLQIAFIQRLKPELEGWPHFKAMSRPFNSTQIVRDIDAGMKFYEDILGFKRVIEHKGASKEPGPNVLGIPVNFTSKIEREVYVLHPQKINDGSVELLKFHDFDGVDHSKVSHFPNLGISLLRFPVNDIAALEKHLLENNVEIVHPVSLIDGVKKLTASSPEGAWLEFFEPVMK